MALKVQDSTSGFADKMLFTLVKCSAEHKWLVSAPSKAVGTFISAIIKNIISQLTSRMDDISKKLSLIIAKKKPMNIFRKNWPGMQHYSSLNAVKFSKFHNS